MRIGCRSDPWKGGVVLGFNLLGDEPRDALDPRSRGI
jgi:hypothetical protein